SPLHPEPTPAEPAAAPGAGTRTAARDSPTLEDRLAAYLGAGTWINTDPLARGVRRLVISPSSEGFAITGWGSCSPRDCEWGDTSLVIIQPGDQGPTAYVRGFAVWDFPERTH